MDSHGIRTLLLKKLELKRSIRRLEERFSSELKGAQLDCLLYLGSYGYGPLSEGVRKAEISGAIGDTVDLPKVSRGLQERGLVEGVYGPGGGKRQIGVKLSEEGEKMYNEILESL